MLDRIIRIAALAAVALALLLGGCDPAGGLEPESDGTPIDFNASSALLRDDATKASEEPITGTAFPPSSKILVFGRRNTETPLLFDGTVVSMGSGSVWGYDDPKQWDWANDPVYYFLAVYRGRIDDPNRTYIPTPAANGNTSPFAVTVAYSYNTDVNSSQEQFDLMMAGLRRRYNDPNPTQVVGLSFEHMLAAVKVIIKNGSAEVSPTAIYLTGYHFENMVVSGQAKASFDNSGNPAFSWSNTNRLSIPIGVVSSINLTLDDATDAYSVEHFHLMIPQSHTGQLGQNYPALVIDYKVESQYGTAKSARVLLKDILQGTEDNLTDNYLTQWERGKKYVYTIKLDLDGGVIVTVTTSPWDEEINAETPGLLLPTEL